LDVKLAEDLWPVMIDVAQLESVLLNLSVNARDAMPNGGSLVIEAMNVTLDEGAVELNPEATPGDYLVISVSDTGTGMSPDVVAKAFDPFFTTKGTAGTGLGLSMVHGFVKQSGGHTRIYSEPGRGTTVRIYLPRATAETIEEPEIDIERSVATGNEMILVVEDNDGLREVAIRRLQELGYRTISAGDGNEGLAVIRGGVPFDLLFTDVVMPGGINGRALAEAAGRLRPDLKVLFTSGFTAAAASATMAEEFGGHLLTKPYRKDELARHVRAALDGAPWCGDHLSAANFGVPSHG
jgi:CheY-like chemotaxis protein